MQPHGSVGVGVGGGRRHYGKVRRGDGGVEGSLQTLARLRPIPRPFQFFFVTASVARRSDLGTAYWEDETRLDGNTIKCFNSAKVCKEQWCMSLCREGKEMPHHFRRQYIEAHRA